MSHVAKSSASLASSLHAVMLEGGSFSDLGSYSKAAYMHRPEPNIFSLLGNTLGNVLDLRDALNGREIHFSDHVHMKAEGSRAFAEALAEGLVPVLTSTAPAPEQGPSSYSDEELGRGGGDRRFVLSKHDASICDGAPQPFRGP